MSTHKGIFKNSDLETISSKLKFISMLQPGQKISVTGQVIQENTYWTSLVRTVTGENRSRVYNFISDVINDSLNILEGLSNSSNDYDIQICKNLISDLIFLRPGLTNLQDTYKFDRMYVSKIKTLMENLDVKTQELCSKRQIDYDQILVDVQKKMQENQVAIDVSGGTVAESVGSEEVEEGSAEGGDEKKKTDVDSKANEIIAEAALILTEDVVAKLDAEYQFKNDTSDLANMVEEPVKKEQIPVLLDRNTPTGRPSEDFDSSGLVSFLRTLPSEDLLLMSTHGGSNGSNMTVNESNRAARRKRKKHAYQYDTYYMSTPDDITLCNEDLEKGLIR